jgi:dTDP-4-dehydrorhamnose reductase
LPTRAASPCADGGSLGQIGTELTDALRTRFGEENVLATSRRPTPPESYPGSFARLDVTDAAAVGQIVEKPVGNIAVECIQVSLSSTWSLSAHAAMGAAQTPKG